MPVGETAARACRKRLQEELPALEVLDVVVVDAGPFRLDAYLMFADGLAVVTAFGNELTTAVRRLTAKVRRSASR